MPKPSFGAPMMDSSSPPGGSSTPFMRNGIPDLNSIMQLLMSGMHGRTGGPMGAPMGQTMPPPGSMPPASSDPSAPSPMAPPPPIGGGIGGNSDPTTSVVPNTNTPTENNGAGQLFNAPTSTGGSWMSKIMPSRNPMMMTGPIVR